MSARLVAQLRQAGRRCAGAGCHSQHQRSGPAATGSLRPQPASCTTGSHGQHPPATKQPAEHEAAHGAVHAARKQVMCPAQRDFCRTAWHKSTRAENRRCAAGCAPKPGSCLTLEDDSTLLLLVFEYSTSALTCSAKEPPSGFRAKGLPFGCAGAWFGGPRRPASVSAWCRHARPQRTPDLCIGRAGTGKQRSRPALLPGRASLDTLVALLPTPHPSHPTHPHTHPHTRPAPESWMPARRC